ncbi:hypothetical protein, partial [Microbulbifer sp.]|uniref:hypothetical protein n=1 Tax=Microbulbifer sp. TaxID=1908541 RepID=UPI002F95118A
MIVSNGILCGFVLHPSLWFYRESRRQAFALRQSQVRELVTVPLNGVAVTLLLFCLIANGLRERRA